MASIDPFETVSEAGEGREALAMPVNPGQTQLNKRALSVD
jgi:hypothetical protein